MWVRGLKHGIRKPNRVRPRVAPRVGAWIETLHNQITQNRPLSHPVWVRGLKQHLFPTLIFGLLSHPVWVRGLKLFAVEQAVYFDFVAPRVGAWIETPLAFAIDR